MSKCDPRTISVLSSSCSPCWYIWWFSVVLSSCSRSLHWSWSLTKPCNNQLLAPREATAPHDHSTSSWLIPLSIPVSKTPSWSLSHRRPDMLWRLSVSGTGLCGDEVLWEINQGLRLIPHSTLSPPPPSGLQLLFIDYISHSTPQFLKDSKTHTPQVVRIGHYTSSRRILVTLSEVTLQIIQMWSWAPGCGSFCKHIEVDLKRDRGAISLFWFIGPPCGESW